ncbi:unnamed protein product [Brachionus calyciflorus]|uniref:STAGA complex 65 subunit gamma n=1 Tax=Brachionus calyciflorus TaxID=104777 RepID=A0A814LSN0_9BILA|nr:unnamed protein product [Brachionus calyciflorus]
MQTYHFEQIHLKKWGEVKLEKLPKELDLRRFRQAKPVLPEEPILPTLISPDLNIFNQIQSLKLDSSNKNQNEKSPNEQTKDKKYKFRPSIDSYIINTIKLNQVLKDKVPFEEIDFFLKSKRKNPKKLKSTKSTLPKVNTDEDAKVYLKQFISIMSIHCGFSQISSLALDTLVDVMDHFLESFFKLLKNLSHVQPFDVNKNEIEGFTNHYSSEYFIEQALVESGIGKINDIKEFYINDILLYYKDTYKKVSKLYDEYKARKNAESKDHNQESDSFLQNKLEDDIHLEQFMKDNEFLNDESNSILGELLSDLNAPHLDEEFSKLLQMIGHDPFSLINEDLQADNEMKESQ